MGPHTSFVDRHIGPRPNDIDAMLSALGLSSLEELVDKTIPSAIRLPETFVVSATGSGTTESEILARLRKIAARNRVYRSFIGMGYYDCITPPVIQRNMLEDPRWYTPYTPYQAEVAQGRLEALLNFQTMVMDMTGMEVANASMLDEATAAAEAMSMCHAIKGEQGRAFFVSRDCHPQTIAVVRTRAAPLGIEVLVGDHRTFAFDRPIFGALLQYPATDGVVYDYTDFIERTHRAGGLVVVAADILALALLKPPGEMGADVAVGNTQRFGVPLGYGGPHAAYFATREAFKRQMPGRIVGVSKDAQERVAYRLALQTREQHIRRERATSNICTAQALLANVAGMYAVYHGPQGLREIAARVHRLARTLERGLRRLGYEIGPDPYFDTTRIPLGGRSLEGILERAEEKRFNLRVLDAQTICVSLDEVTTPEEVHQILEVFSDTGVVDSPVEIVRPDDPPAFGTALQRESAYLTHPVFNSYHSETELLRYMNRLQARDLSLATSMIPLGSCTMKLNAAAEMIPITWPEFSRLHPFAPLSQAEGYLTLFRELEAMLCEITGFDGVTFQPNAGSQGEYTGLLIIRKYHADRGEGHRDVCLIPQSAHGTNPASAVMAGMRVVVVRCDEAGNVDVDDLCARAREHSDHLAALMITYPSTHGVFEEAIREICDITHRYGGQVYMDGANMNAQVALCRPGDFGPDLCHLNLHKTFCIPHGGGGPGMGPVCVKKHLLPYLPRHPVVPVGGEKGLEAVAAAPWGSPSILPISYAYIALMGWQGLARASQIAILNANYIAHRLDPYYPVLYKGKNGFVAHECILDLRPLKSKAGIEVEDVAKRLMDYGFHAPTISWPVPGTMMIEPTESESKGELDRFCEAMIAIRAEIAEIEEGRADREDNLLKNAPHPAEQITRSDWTHPYSRERAAFPAPWLHEGKYWPPVSRIDNAFGDRHLVCACPPLDTYA